MTDKEFIEMIVSLSYACGLCLGSAIQGETNMVAKEALGMAEKRINDVLDKLIEDRYGVGV